MSSPNETTFQPTEIWTPDAKGSYELDEPIRLALEEMNGKNPQQLIVSLENTVERSPSGVSYAVLKGGNPNKYSDREALVIFNPFANVASPNMLVRAEFIREVAKFSNVRDAEGKLKPVVMLASPGIGGSKSNLSSEDREAVRDGELGPYARELLKVVDSKGIGNVALLGFSQGADVAVAGVRQAYSANLDTHALAVGDPAGTYERSRPALFMDFMKSGPKDLTKAVEATGLEVLNRAQDGPFGYAKFGISALRGLNPDLYKGMASGKFETRLQEVIDEGVVDKIVVGYGADSAIAEPKYLEPSLQRIHENNGSDSIVSIKVDGAKHTWGDQLTLLAKLYMRAVA